MNVNMFIVLFAVVVHMHNKGLNLLYYIHKMVQTFFEP